LDLPGMRVLQFAFDGDAGNVHLPHNHVRNAIVYTGTHDNPTALGWWAGLDAAARAQVRDYLGPGDEVMPWLLIRPTLASVAGCAVLPLQDVLDPSLAERLRHLFALYGRLPDSTAPAAAAD
jgi:4-alpha-glucanotransferase